MTELELTFGPFTQLEQELGKPVPRFTINLVVHDSLEEIRSAADAHDEADAGTYGEIGAVFHQADPEDDPRPWFLGTLRLHSGMLDIDTIVHETVHIAVFFAQRYFKASKWRPLKLPVDVDRLEREEFIAYVAGPVASNLVDIVAPMCVAPVVSPVLEAVA